jgi:protein O-GlcNAc transferase
MPTQLRDRSLLDSGIAHHQAGRLDDAASIYQHILAQDPEYPDALHLSGLLECDRGNAPASLPLLAAALRAAPDRAAFHNTHARALAACDQTERAEAAYRAAWRLRPDLAEIANNLACLQRDRGDLAGAIAWFRHAAARAPDNAAVALNLAKALAAHACNAESLTQFHRAALLDPTNADVHYGLARVQLVLGQPEAEQSLREALRLRPGHAPSLNNLGVALERQGKPAAAAACIRAALRADPANPDAHSNLGCLLLLDGEHSEARAAHERALAADPHHGRALWGRCMAELPMLYANQAEIAAQRARYDQALANLAASAADPTHRAALAAAIGASQPFFLPYQGDCDRALQARYGALLTSLLDPDPEIRLAPPLAPGERLRLGIVTGFACEHTVWRLMVKGWLTHLDRTRFHVTLYHTGHITDGETAAAQALADRYVAAPADIRAALIADRPHALIYPELGMDPLCARLAVERFAPLQCVAWGQPQTSGLPAIDVFLSSQAMEPPGAEAHYTERLVRLPGLGIAPMLQPADAEQSARASFGLRESATVYWCGQALYKYLPQHDQILTRIARAVPDSQFVFIGFARSPAATDRFRDRLERAFAAAGLDAAQHLVMLDSMEQPRFHASIRAADIVLDSIGWSGGKSTLDMLSDHPVIVTHAALLMRGRHTAAILRSLGIEDTIAPTLDQYVALATSLAQNHAARAALRQRLAQATPALLCDHTPIRALEDFLLTTCAALPQNCPPPYDFPHEAPAL